MDETDYSKCRNLLVKWEFSKYSKTYALEKIDKNKFCQPSQ
jgi:hypothetical protein